MDHHGESLAHAHEARGDRGAQEAAETLVADEKKMQQSQEDAGGAAACATGSGSIAAHRLARCFGWRACWPRSAAGVIQRRFSYVVAELITLSSSPSRPRSECAVSQIIMDCNLEGVTITI